ncbi:hypothetical protein QBC38DRAFT_476160 [Podospora fimiseda]|uniref:Aminoglycoside phosphotransferase domain-containing protein n=1 Tax=Podospora fimiseda TaxID=252190 RepID=A0AAN7BRD8_9PEZI|nr:hypothetical protein QBC38DRAFT_476160 [Podospora fimiseda]
MLLNPVLHTPFAGPQPQTSHQRISVDPDPFQSLYDSLANLTLTPNATYPQPQQAPPESIQIDENESLPTSPVTDLTPIPASILFPPGDNVIFAHSSFFTSPLSRGVELPTPSHIRADLITRAFTSGIFPTSLPLETAQTSELIPFPSLGLLVKYGGEDIVSSTEGKTLMMIKRLLEDRVPVPEVFGWRRDAEAKERVLYMSLPQGRTLHNRWGELTLQEKDGVCESVRRFVREWRRLSQAPGRAVVGSIDNTPLRDEVFKFSDSEKNGLTIPAPGPFGTVGNFHSYFVATAVALSQNRGNKSQGTRGEVNYQPHHLFPDNVPLAFTHGALHPRNIIVAEGANPRVVAIIGWEQAGWYPAYWELCKAKLECSRYGGGLDEWETRYLPGILSLDGYGLESQGWNGRALVQYWDYFVGLMH